MKTRFNFWIDKKELDKIKKRANEKALSTSSYVKMVLKETEKAPNQYTGDWWDNPEEIIKSIKRLKR